MKIDHNTLGDSQNSDLSSISINIAATDQTQILLYNKLMTKHQDRSLVGCKSLTFILVFLFLLIGKLYFVPSIDVECLNDPVHNLLSWFNGQVNRGSDTAVVLQVSSSLLMDLSFVYVFVHWVIFTRSSRLVLVVGVFYLFRAFNQTLIQMTYPDGFFWDYPGFPSLVVPYGRTSDFFFSGHTGFLTICFFEWKALKNTRMMLVTLVVLVYMIFILLIFRTHYSIGSYPLNPPRYHDGLRGGPLYIHPGQQPHPGDRRLLHEDVAETAPLLFQEQDQSIQSRGGQELQHSLTNYTLYTLT